MNKELFETVQFKIKEESVKQAVVGILRVCLDIVDGGVLHQILELVASCFDANNCPFATSSSEQLVFDKFDLKLV
jgi:hypothetical protein